MVFLHPCLSKIGIWLILWKLPNLYYLALAGKLGGMSLWLSILNVNFISNLFKTARSFSSQNFTLLDSRPFARRPQQIVSRLPSNLLHCRLSKAALFANPPTTRFVHVFSNVPFVELLPGLGHLLAENSPPLAVQVQTPPAAPLRDNSAKKSIHDHRRSVWCFFFLTFFVTFSSNERQMFVWESDRTVLFVMHGDMKY